MQVLDEAELKRVFNAMGQTMLLSNDKKFAKAFKQIDKDGEGSIDFEELLVHSHPFWINLSEMTIGN